jgi:hypothetical protein
MKHLKLFNDTVSYETWKNSEGFVLPNVSYIIEGNTVSYNPAIMNYPDIILQEGNVYPEVGARLSQMFNKYMAKYNRTIIQSPHDEYPNIQFEIMIINPGEYDDKMHAAICFNKLDENGYVVPDESPEVFGPNIELEINDLNYLMSLKYFDGYENLDVFDVGAFFYPMCVAPNSTSARIDSIGFDGTLTFLPQPE